ncbi:MAG: hypothetical protein HYU66_26960 [Armatimonadetes bacterium]|nr:hypothetical protein [Armatimonadota bacterium]
MHRAVLLALVAAPAVAAPLPRSCLSLPRVAAPPRLDGRVAPAEWSDAAAVTGFLASGGGSLAEPQTRLLACYDADALYLAVICAEPEPGRPLAYKRPHDDRCGDDDSVSILIAPEDPHAAKQGHIAFGGYEGAYDTWYAELRHVYTFTVNAAGSRAEACNDVADWSADWSAATARQGQVWTAEIALPFRSLGLHAAPDDALWGFNVVRRRIPELSAWDASGNLGPGYAPPPIGAVLFGGRRPFARLMEVPSEDEKLALELVNPGEQATTVELLLPPRDDLAQSLEVAAGGRVCTAVPWTPAPGRAGYVVRSASSPLVSGSVPVPAPPAVTTAIRHFTATAQVDGLVRNGSGAARKAVLTIDAEPSRAAAEARDRPLPPPWQGRGEVTRNEAPLEGKSGCRLVLPFAGDAGRRGVARLQVFDAAGTVLAETTRELTIPPRPAWLGTQAGLPLGVLPPWTPITVKGKSVSLLGKELRYGDLALPAAIVSAGSPLLAAPSRVVVTTGGKPVAWTSRACRIAEQAADHVRIESLWRSPRLELAVTSTVEYDGFTWNEVALRPLGEATIERVALELPLRREVAKYAYEGHAQAGHAIAAAGLHRDLAENLWIGNEERGLAWLAESLEWAHVRDRARQVEVTYHGGTALWRSVFRDHSGRLTAPLTARFALHVTPAKPVPLSRARIWGGGFYGLETARAPAVVELPADSLEPRRGAFEAWVRPGFDPGEEYDPTRDRSAYNRFFLTFTAPGGDGLIVYYNADDRSFRALVVRPGTAQVYPVVMGSPQRLVKDQWTYVGVSWGDSVRLNVGGREVSVPWDKPLCGDLAGQRPRLDLSLFELDALRLSKDARPLPWAPAGAPERDGLTTWLDHCDQPPAGMHKVAGRFGDAWSAAGELLLDQVKQNGTRRLLIWEHWSRWQGYPDLEQTPKLKAMADAAHARGMQFLVYFNQHISGSTPEWPGMRDDFLIPDNHSRYREQDVYYGCPAGPWGDLILDGVQKLADAGIIDGVYMDGTTVPWYCENPSHPACGEDGGDGRCQGHSPIRATRTFMKRLRNIFARTGRPLWLDAHTGGCLNIATQSFCDGFYEGETLSHFRPDYRIPLDTFAAGYMGRQWGVRTDFLPSHHTADQALAIALIHDVEVRGGDGPAVLAADRVLEGYQDLETRFIGYWAKSDLYRVDNPRVVASLYLRPERALLVMGSQSEEAVTCRLDLGGLLRRLPGAKVRDAISGVELRAPLVLALPARGWRMLEVSAAPR